MQVMHTYVGHKNLDVSIRDLMCYFSSGRESAASFHLLGFWFGVDAGVYLFIYLSQ